MRPSRLGGVPALIAKLLVANRAEIARRVFRTARRLGIATVAVHTDTDARAPFVAEADEAVRLDSYLRADRVVEAALRAGADAVHPGYGFLAENAELAQRCADAGLTWVGPPAHVIALAGSKLKARELAAAAGVPVLDDSGFPLLVKASAGGGGRGMRLVRTPAELEDAKASAAREAEAAFGDGTLYLERYVEGARHVEVQLLGDAHGTVVHLWGRDCTVQRRWQKVIEEAPVVDERILAAALRVGEAVGYVNAGTAEFLLTPDGEFFFLELNARLQVEHPVTEEVTGLDLVEIQIRIAEGAAVPAVPEPAGHAIEARLYAESAGTVSRFRVDGVRVESGVEEGTAVATEYDPMLAKLISHAPTRSEAVRALAGALRRARIHGVETNRDLLVAALEHPDFAADRLDTSFLERVEVPRRDERLEALTAALAGQAARRAGHSFPSGWRNNPSEPQRTTFQGYDVRYRLGGPYEVNGDELDARLLACSPEAVELETGGVRRRFEVHLVGDVAYVDSPLGAAALRELPRFPEPGELDPSGSLLSPLPGSIVRIAVEPGEEVAAGQPLVVLEAMKMEHTISAPYGGRIAEVRVAEGEQVEGGRVLVVLEDAS
ncbi:MAG TPA: biotin carboxylase N-terminal domain-containing protein [Gaiellaceae bacterium]|nr:biotin carboxylase N-terminal domain-containing protein [Gaiellaceae bacterium]